MTASRKHTVLTSIGGALLLSVAVCGFARAGAPAIIPNPATVDVKPGEFHLSAATPIVVPAGDREAAQVADRLRELIQKSHGWRLPLRTGAARNAAINLGRERKAALGKEGYRLRVARERITLTAATANGLFYASVSLWQMLDAAEGKNFIPVGAVAIDDAPRFAWRGLMLDSARHYQSPEFIRRFIDWMAVHKLNVLHWHLTDDQAWRLEIKKYPKLTEIAAWRVPAGAAAAADLDPATGKPRQYGGFYTQQTARELVRYAAARGITIVPEIEMPGHASATLVAYPQLAASAHPPATVSPDWGIHSNVYNPEEATFTFLQDVLGEVMAVFPGKHIHVGGDEVEKTQWQESARVQARMRALGIAEPAALQTYFTQRIGRFLQQHGRRLVGWDEILQPGLPKESVVMSWRGIDGALAAAAGGFDTILSPWPTLYFDNRQSAAADEPPGRVKVISLEDVYRFEPMPDKLDAAQRRHVLGLQGNIWTEHIRTEERVAAMTFPRAAAVAELGWSAPGHRDWRDFVSRLGAQLGRYRALDLPFADSAFAPQAALHYSANEVTAILTTQAGYGDIRYTLDGSEPGALSARYQEPLRLPLPTDLRVATFAGEHPLSRARLVPLRRELAQRRASQELKLCSEGIALSLEDDAPVKGARAIFMVDVQKPCWIFPQADLAEVTAVVAAVGQVPFNFQIGKLVDEIKFDAPVTAEGELEVRLDDCRGEVIARLPLAPAAVSQAVTVLPRAALTPLPGRHDLCLRFAQRFDPSAGDPLWTLDWVQLVGRANP